MRAAVQSHTTSDPYGKGIRILLAIAGAQHRVQLCSSVPFKCQPQAVPWSSALFVSFLRHADFSTWCEYEIKITPYVSEKPRHSQIRQRFLSWVAPVPTCAQSHGMPNAALPKTHTGNYLSAQHSATWKPLGLQHHSKWQDKNVWPDLSHYRAPHLFMTVWLHPMGRLLTPPETPGSPTLFQGVFTWEKILKIMWGSEKLEHWSTSTD